MHLDRYFQQLDRQEAAALALARQLPAHTPPAEGRWTPIQELEHVCLTEGLVQRLLLRPSEQRAGKPELMGDAKLEKLVVQGRQYKISAPERLHPKGSFTEADGFAACFCGQRAQFKEDLRSGRILPDDRVYPHPVLGDLTSIDWLYFLHHHTERHLVSLRESLHLPAPVE